MPFYAAMVLEMSKLVNLSTAPSCLVEYRHKMLWPHSKNRALFFFNFPIARVEIIEIGNFQISPHPLLWHALYPLQVAHYFSSIVSNEDTCCVVVVVCVRGGSIVTNIVLPHLLLINPSRCKLSMGNKIDVFYMFTWHSVVAYKHIRPT